MGKLPTARILAAAILGSADAFFRAAVHDQTGVTRQQSACSCLNWRSVYSDYRVNCGQALEFHLVTKRGVTGAKASRMIGDEFCGKFFKRINDNFCVNADFTHAPSEWTGRQWCYVSSECTQLRGGRPLPGSNASWKFCAQDDNMLRMKTPNQLDTLRGKLDLDLGLMAKFAYPIWQAGKWPEVQHFLLGGGAAGLRADSGRVDLEQVVASGDPMLFDSPTGHPPFHIVMGPGVYKVDFTEHGRQKYAQGRMGAVNGLKCLQGCGWAELP